ncbi:MAG: redox-regulated ATPase YchF [Clostridia bacterium]|nr:redox-regulated ATPase YchF [Clostridia bacterium]
MSKASPESAKKMLKSDKSYQEEIDLIEKIKNVLEQGLPARSIEYTEEEQSIVKDMFLLTTKPILYVANVSEDQLGNSENDENVLKVKEYAQKENSEVIALCVKIEEEISTLDDEDKKEMLEAIGLEESGLDKLIRKSYDLLGLMSFLTAGEPEVRAWTIKKGTKAPQAAGKIHSDIEKGFIKAEVVSFDDLIKEGSMANVKEKGLLRLEGKDYIMQDGDIVLFKFNV